MTQIMSALIAAGILTLSILLASSILGLRRWVSRLLYRPRHRLGRGVSGEVERYERRGFFDKLSRIFVPNFPDNRKVIYRKVIRRGRSRVVLGEPRPPKHMR